MGSETVVKAQKAGILPRPTGELPTPKVSNTRPSALRQKAVSYNDVSYNEAMREPNSRGDNSRSREDLGVQGGAKDTELAPMTAPPLLSGKESCVVIPSAMSTSGLADVSGAAVKHHNDGLGGAAGSLEASDDLSVVQECLV